MISWRIFGDSLLFRACSNLDAIYRRFPFGEGQKTYFGVTSPPPQEWFFANMAHVTNTSNPSSRDFKEDFGMVFVQGLTRDICFPRGIEIHALILNTVDVVFLAVTKKTKTHTKTRCSYFSRLFVYSHVTFLFATK